MSLPNPEIIENDVNGFLIKPDAVGDICENILGFYTNRALMEQMTRTNIEKSQSYTVGSMMDEYVQIYRGILKKNERKH